METNDFLGSFAQENVSFSTQIVRTASVGDNFWTAMIFVESDRFVQANAANGWEDAPNLPSCKVLVVTADNYAEYTTGMLQAWLYDLFCNGFSGNAILVAPAASATDVVNYEAATPTGDEDPAALGWYELSGTEYVLTTDSTVDTSKTYYIRTVTPADTSAFINAMTEAYAVLKPYAYHKTVCAGSDDKVTPAYAVALAKLCATDDYLSGAPLLPISDPTLQNDALYSALIAESTADAFMGWHSDSTRNPALYSLGLALAVTNASGTSVGNGLDMTASTNITASNGGINPTAAQKNVLKAAYVQYFKTVGDNSGSVAAETDKTIRGKTYAAYWILAYITYMVRVRIAQMLTQRNFYKNALNYHNIVATMENVIKLFDGAGLENIVISAPSFAEVKDMSGDDEIVIPNAWSATYVNHLRKVTITGTLYIGS